MTRLPSTPNTSKSSASPSPLGPPEHPRNPLGKFDFEAPPATQDPPLPCLFDLEHYRAEFPATFAKWNAQVYKSRMNFHGRNGVVNLEQRRGLAQRDTGRFLAAARAFLRHGQIDAHEGSEVGVIRSQVEIEVGERRNCSFMLQLDDMYQAAFSTTFIHGAAVVVLWARPEHSTAATQKVTVGNANCGHWISPALLLDGISEQALRRIVDIFSENVSMNITDKLTFRWRGRASSTLQDKFAIEKIFSGLQITNNVIPAPVPVRRLFPGVVGPFSVVAPAATQASPSIFTASSSSASTVPVTGAQTPMEPLAENEPSPLTPLVLLWLQTVAALIKRKKLESWIRDPTYKYASALRARLNRLDGVSVQHVNFCIELLKQERLILNDDVLKICHACRVYSLMHEQWLWLHSPTMTKRAVLLKASVTRLSAAQTHNADPTSSSTAGVEHSAFNDIARSGLIFDGANVNEQYAYRLSDLFDHMKDEIADIAEELGYTFEQVEKDVFAHSLAKRARGTSAYNIYCKQRWAVEGHKSVLTFMDWKRTAQFKADWKAVTPELFRKLEEEALEYDESKNTVQLKEAVFHRNLDACKVVKHIERILQELFARTRISGVCFLARTLGDDIFVPARVSYGPALNYFAHALNINIGDLLENLDIFTRGGSTALAEVQLKNAKAWRTAVRKVMNEAMSEFKAGASMSWEAYEKRVVIGQGLRLVGFPVDLAITDVGNYGRLQLQRIHEAVKQGICHWEEIPAEELQVLKEEFYEDVSSEDEERTLGKKTQGRSRMSKAGKRQKTATKKNSTTSVSPVTTPAVTTSVSPASMPTVTTSDGDNLTKNLPAAVLIGELTTAIATSKPGTSSVTVILPFSEDGSTPVDIMTVLEPSLSAAHVIPAALNVDMVTAPPVELVKECGVCWRAQF